MATTQILPRAPSDRTVQAPADITTAPADRERRLLRRVHLHGDMQARAQLAEDMLPLARTLAHRYINRGEPLDDLVQVACIGVVKAIDGFDVDRPVALASYATPTVLGEIKRHFRDKTWLMRVPRPMKERHLRVVQARERLTHRLGRAPAVHEIAATIDASSGDVVAAIDTAGARRARSFDEPAGEHVTLADSLGAVDPEIERAELRALLGSAFDILSEREQAILHLRFDEDLSQVEIAQCIGVSPMQVSRLIARSLARVRVEIESRTTMAARCPALRPERAAA
jgi:RNA polymerase sigma-B factor